MNTLSVEWRDVVCAMKDRPEKLLRNESTTCDVQSTIEPTAHMSIPQIDIFADSWSLSGQVNHDISVVMKSCLIVYAAFTTVDSIEQVGARILQGSGISRNP